MAVAATAIAYVIETWNTLINSGTEERSAFMPLALLPVLVRRRSPISLLRWHLQRRRVMSARQSLTRSPTYFDVIEIRRDVLTSDSQRVSIPKPFGISLRRVIGQL